MVGDELVEPVFDAVEDLLVGFPERLEVDVEVDDLKIVG